LIPVGEWLRDRRNALIDAVLIYLASEWLVPGVVSAVAYLGSSEVGIEVLLMIGYCLVIGTGIAVACKYDHPTPETTNEDWEVVWVLGYPTAPHFLGSRGRWIRVPRRQEPDSS
jgi:hypothetical protein